MFRALPGKRCGQYRCDLLVRVCTVCVRTLNCTPLCGCKHWAGVRACARVHSVCTPYLQLVQQAGSVCCTKTKRVSCIVGLTHL